MSQKKTPKNPKTTFFYRGSTHSNILETNRENYEISGLQNAASPFHEITKNNSFLISTFSTIPLINQRLFEN